MKTENQKQDTEEVYLNQLIDEANKEFSLDRKLAKKVALKFAKWQQEQDKNLYSEEEVHAIIESYQNNVENNPNHITYDKWFEKLKKK